VPRAHFNSADALLRALACANQHCPCHRSVSLGRGLTHCPAHDDQHPSLSVQPGRVAVLWKCHAGCDRGDVALAIRNLGL
jgi:hypothetical protein